MIPLNDGYLGSLIFSITLITAGKLASIFSIPNSVDLAIETFEALGSTETEPAKVNCAQPKRSANIAGTTLIRASVDSVPQITKSKPPSEIALLKTNEVASASEPASAPSQI